MTKMTLFDTFDFLGRKNVLPSKKMTLLFVDRNVNVVSLQREKEERGESPPQPPKTSFSQIKLLLPRCSNYYFNSRQTTTSTVVKLLLPRTAQAQQRSRYNIRPPPGHLPIPTPPQHKVQLISNSPPEPARNVNMLKSVLILP